MNSNTIEKKKEFSPELTSATFKFQTT